jgi:uncharacterized protein
MTRKLFQNALLVLCAAFAFTTMSPALAQNSDPSMDQVYQAAKAGRLDDAQNMMQRVLHDHPDSAMAHYVEAQLLATQARYSAASGELQRAESLSPGLAFAKPESVAELRNLIATQGGRVANRASPYVQPASSGSHFGGTLVVILMVGIGIFLIVALVRATNRVAPAMGPGGYLPGGPAPMVGPGGMPMYPTGGMPMGGGIGSGIMGGLATGAAVGAGIVAGEALMHHVLDPSRPQGYVPPEENMPPAQDNLGGQDFGVSDAGSWDDSGSSSLSDGLDMGGGGGGGDWN